MDAPPADEDPLRRESAMDRGFNPDLGVTILRVVLGVTFIAHGAPKLFGGMEATAGYFAGLGIPLAEAVAWLVALLEFGGGIALLLGFLVVPVSLLLLVQLLVGIVLVHAPNGWYVVGPGTGGVEFSVVLGAGLLMLVFGGPGLAAADTRRRRVRGG